MRGVKGQVVSIDLILSIVIFTTIIIGFFYLITIFAESNDTSRIQRESEDIPRGLQSNISSFAFIRGNNIDINKLLEFSGKSYDDLHDELGLKNDFCIYFVDDSGHIIPINNKAGMGSDKVFLGDQLEYRCGRDIDELEGVGWQPN